MNMNIYRSWISLCWILAAVCAVQTTYTLYTTVRCECNGRSRLCLRDAQGLHCVDCQGNTEGRHCERCKDGFYLAGAGRSCMRCRCNATGAVSASCDGRGRCSCREGVSGDKCDRCHDGPIGPNGCSHSRQTREDIGSQSPSCFCYGHSSQCSAQSGYSIHNITSTFTDGPEGWRAATAHGVTPHNIHFRWSPKHQDLEVISKNSLPVYLYAPAPYLGNQLLSYGQNFSFSLRLDRGVRHPSTNDLILEGSGLQVATSLGDLRSIIPCGQKIKYSFRLDQQLGSRWRPQLSSSQFHTLLQNLTAIKIRATFGENGRGYLNNVQLGSARRGPGAPADWVQRCLCPPGYDGEFCERCSVGFTRRTPTLGAFSPCEPCSCRGGRCDPQTGDCYSADETPAEHSCANGFYPDPWHSWACLKCPCPQDVSCSLPDGSFEPRCNFCPPGATGPLCDVCQEGFFGDPAGETGVPRPCRPCQCNGHIDVSIVGSCDRRTGECLKCVNNTMGRSCETCLAGFYNRQPTDACKPCDCDVVGSESRQCDDLGRCRCRLGFDGSRCQRSNCPACFSSIKAKLEAYTAKLQELQKLFSEMDGGLKPANSAEIEAAVRVTKELVNNLQDSSEQLTELEDRLKARLASISRSQLTEGQDVQNMVDAIDAIKQRQQTYKTKVERVQTLTDEMRSKLQEAKNRLRSAELPSSDAPLDSHFLSSLVLTATSLADKHQTKATAVEQSANEALSDSEKSLNLVRTLMNRENKIRELIGDLKTNYDQTTAQAKSLENQAARVSGEAEDESKMADSMLKDITNMEWDVPVSLKEAMDAMVTRLDGVKEGMDGAMSGYEMLQDGMQRDKTTAEDLLEKSKNAQQKFNKLLGRVTVAKNKTEDAQQRINSNIGELDDALDTLKGFDQQIGNSRSMADTAIERLPDINATIQQAIGDNAKTLSVLEDVSSDYNSALGSINQLENLVTSLEGMFDSLPSHINPLTEATKLKEAAKGLKADATTTAEDLVSQLETARRQEGDAEEAAVGADAVFTNTKQTNDAVGETLRKISGLLENIKEPGVVEESRLQELEESLAFAQKEVQVQLKPRLSVMAEQEAAQQRRLSNLNMDIDMILGDISNLEDILRVVPTGCFNSQPIEEP